MRIAILGAGNQGGALARRWAAAGHEIIIASRDPDSPRVRELLSAMGANARALPVADACADAEVVLITTPWPATRGALEEAGDLSGKVVLDATNPLEPAVDGGLQLIPGVCAGLEVAGWLPGAEVVKAFNTVGSPIVDDPRFGDVRPVLLYATDSARAGEAAHTLATEMGLNAVHLGGMEFAAHLEHLAMIWIHLALSMGHGAKNITFALLQR